LRAYPTDRRFRVHDAEEYGYLLSATYGRPVPASCVPVFGTGHHPNRVSEPHRIERRSVIGGLISEYRRAA
jgi:hypothetical protein